MLQLFLELAPCLICGMALGRLAPQLPTLLSPPLLRWGVPISLVGLLLKAGIQSGNGQAALFTLVLTGGGLLLTQRWPWLQRALPVRSLQLGAMVSNTAYFGLPVALALLPPQALSFSITYDLVGHTGNTSDLRPALVIKLLALPGLTLLGTWVLGMTGPLRDALVLQAAAPTAMSVLLLAEASQEKGRESIPAAQLVLWSTVLSLASVPLWWWLLAQPLRQATVAM